MLYTHAPAAAVFLYEGEPLPDAFEQDDVGAETAEVAAVQADAARAGFIEHHFHVGKDVAGILPGGQSVAHLPELGGCLADGLDESELLHVPRREGSVEIVDEGDDGFSFHFGTCSFFATNIRILQI